MNSLRLEKGYLVLGGEISSERTPLEAGLERLVDFGKPFLGRQALLNQREVGLTQKLALLTVEAVDADAIGDEPIYCQGKMAGRVASGGYGHCVGRSLALGYLDLDCIAPGTELEIPIFGRTCAAKAVASPLYDPENKNLRM